MAKLIEATDLLEALEVAKREELRLSKDKKNMDARMNRLIGVEQKKQTAILEELDAVRSGRDDYLPFSDHDWTADVQDRDANV
jgi:hypothetical protein